MSDLDALFDIADSNAFAAHQDGVGKRRAANKHPKEFCGGGHRWTEETTRRYRYKGRVRRICRVCDKIRKGLR